MGVSYKVLLVDDHTLVREGIRAIIERSGEFRVVAEASTAAEAVEACAKMSPELVISNIELPDRSGIDLTRELLRENRSARVIMLSRSDDEETVIDALRSGARGFVLKHASSADLMEALNTVARGGSYFSSEASERLMARIRRGDFGSRQTRPAWQKLTPRELEVLRLVSAGKSSKQIADMLHLGVETVRSYRKSMMKKIGVSNVASLVQFAISQGLTRWTQRGPGSYT
ncbi:MAG: DNA-binding response regulator [Acidobacteria bacterium]|nr:MAG: DNA-binding response regulator [Acidobacteriota bacterium]